MFLYFARACSLCLFDHFFSLPFFSGLSVFFPTDGSWKVSI